jgi:hypothetical protein
MVVEIGAQDRWSEEPPSSSNPQANLSAGMFCRVELPAELRRDALLIPRHAVYDDRWVYLFEGKSQDESHSTGTLVRREVKILRNLKDDVLVENTRRPDSAADLLQTGDRIVVSPLVRPIPGMAVRLGTADASPNAAPVPRLTSAKHRPDAGQ